VSIHGFVPSIQLGKYDKVPSWLPCSLSKFITFDSFETYMHGKPLGSKHQRLRGGNYMVLMHNSKTCFHIYIQSKTGFLLKTDYWNGIYKGSPMCIL
jgi:hypothetical protein